MVTMLPAFVPHLARKSGHEKGRGRLCKKRPNLPPCLNLRGNFFDHPRYFLYSLLYRVAVAEKQGIGVLFQ